MPVAAGFEQLHQNGKEIRLVGAGENRQHLQVEIRLPVFRLDPFLSRFIRSLLLKKARRRFKCGRMLW